jgi:hypothetical protein
MARAERASTSMEIIWSLSDEEHILCCQPPPAGKSSLALAQCRCVAVCGNCWRCDFCALACWSKIVVNAQLKSN